MGGLFQVDVRQSFPHSPPPPSEVSVHTDHSADQLPSINFSLRNYVSFWLPYVLQNMGISFSFSRTDWLSYKKACYWADLSGRIVTAINLTNRKHLVAFSAVLLILNELTTIMLKRMHWDSHSVTSWDSHCPLMSVTAYHIVLGSFPPSAFVLYPYNTADSVREVINSCALFKMPLSAFPSISSSSCSL